VDDFPRPLYKDVRKSKKWLLKSMLIMSWMGNSNIPKGQFSELKSPTGQNVFKMSFFIALFHMKTPKNINFKTQDT